MATEAEREQNILDWLAVHPEITRCKLCHTFVPAKLTFKELCPSCYEWNNLKAG